MHLDFVASPPRARWPGAALLVAGAAMAAATAVDWQRTAGAAAGLRLQIGASAAIRHAVSGSPPADQLASVAAASRELAMPWAQMLGDLESAGLESAGDVALLAIAPDSKSGRIGITAEARTLPLALAYLRRLQGRPAVHDAVLIAHEIQGGVAERPVRIQISALWRRGA